MAATRGSSRQAAMKAKEAIANTSEPNPLSTAGAKRKGSVDKGPVPKKEKKIDQEANQEAKRPSEEAGKPVKEEPGKTGMAKLHLFFVLLQNLTASYRTREAWEWSKSGRQGIPGKRRHRTVEYSRKGHCLFLLPAACERRRGARHK